MNKIIIHFSYSPNNIFSWIIRKVLKSEFSHSSIEIDGFIYESAWGGVHITEKEKWTKAHVVISLTLDVTPEEKRRLISKLNRHDDKPYGTLTLFGVLIYHAFSIKLFNDKNKSFTCSEYVYVALKKAEIIHVKVLSPDYITPPELFTILRMTCL